MEKRLRYVIIGNSAAGIGAVEGIRQVDKQGEITIISNEPHHTYSRPLISYLLLGKTDEQRMKYRDDDFYIKNKVTLLTNTTVTKLLSDEGRVITSDNKVIPYDRLLVATGSSAAVPKFDGIDTVKNKFTFMTLDDARGLSSVLDSSSRVLIVGAGLIGLKCAEGICNGVASVTVVDLAPTILSSILDADGGMIVQNHLESKGIKFKLSHSVKSFDKSTAIVTNNTTNQEDTIDFDILVLAVGVRPNTALLDGIAKIDRGIVVNSRMETLCTDTSNPNEPNVNIYAAGDCTQGVDISSGESKIMALLPNAYMQGECAGINMAGGNAEFDKAIPMNAVGFFGLHIITAGNYMGSTYNAKTAVGDYKKLYYSDNRLNGFVMIGNVLKAGIYTSLIRERTPLNTVDFDLVCKKPGLIAFSTEKRQLKLGGSV